MELFELIRRDRDVEELSIRALAERYGVHRRMVCQALESAVSPSRKTPEGRPAPALGAFHEVGEIEAFVPQAHRPGQTAEVDWGQAEVVLAGARSQVNLFVLRLSHSGAGLVLAFGHATQQAFLEGHVEAFAFLGGVPHACATTTCPRRSS